MKDINHSENTVSNIVKLAKVLCRKAWSIVLSIPITLENLAEPLKSFILIFSQISVGLGKTLYNWCRQERRQEGLILMRNNKIVIGSNAEKWERLTKCWLMSAGVLSSLNCAISFWCVCHFCNVWKVGEILSMPNVPPGPCKPPLVTLI